jgi:hypothetical protein
MSSLPPGVRLIAARVPADEAKRIDDWRRAQERIPPMSDALRHLAMHGLLMLEQFDDGKAVRE